MNDKNIKIKVRK